MRKMTLLIVAWCSVIVVWAVAGGSHAASTCTRYADGSLLHNACQAGAGLGVAVILFVGFVGFVFLSLIWLMTKPAVRECSVCGMDVRRGATTCPHCETDFAEQALVASARAAIHRPVAH